MTKSAILLTIGLAIYLAGCGDENPVAGGTNTGNARGTLVRSDGTPAAGVTVYFFDVSNNPQPITAKRHATMAATDSAVTDSAGNFADSLAAGTYNMIAADDTTGAFQDSVEIVDGDTTTFADDTLKPFGSITGTIELEQDGDVRTVFVLVLGTNTWTVPDAGGRFTLSNMAEGNYSVRILTTLDKYAVVDTSLAVTAGQADTLTGGIPIKYTGIPTVQGVGITYDTLLQIVTIAWSSDDTSFVKGYNIYRKHSDSDFVKINAALVTDTFYYDSTAVQDQTYEYKITAVDQNDNEGDKREGDTVAVVTPYVCIDSLGKGISAAPYRISISSDGHIYILDYEERKICVFDSQNSHVKTIQYTLSNYPHDFDVDSAGYIYVAHRDGVYKYDTSGAFLDTVLLWDHTDTKHLSISESYLFVTNRYPRKYSIDGDLRWDGNPELRGGALIAGTDKLYFLANNTIKMLDTSGVTTNEWNLAYSIYGASKIALDSEERLYVTGNISGRNTGYAFFVHDQSNSYNARMPIAEIAKDIGIHDNRILLIEGSYVKILIPR